LPAGQWLAEGMPAADKEAKVRSIKAIIEWLDVSIFIFLSFFLFTALMHFIYGGE
jgi:hypothetical protein